VEERLEAAEARLTEVAGDRSLCDLSRAGAPGGVKDLEGRASALRQVRRAMRRGTEHPMACAERVLGEWRHELELDRVRGPVWERYRRGGVDELERLCSAIDDLS
jgi:hypothetical protein